MPRLHLVRRMGWGVVDQGFISLSNFALGVVVARLGSPTEFGAFGLAFAVYLVALNIARGFATQPLAIRFGSRDSVEFRRGTVDATGLALLLGLLGTGVCLVLAAIFQGPLGLSLAGLAIALPGLLLQDAWRYVLFTDRRGQLAMVNDLVAVVCMALLIGFVLVLDLGSVLTIMVCWGGGATAAAILGSFQTGCRPALGRAVGWWREHWDITPRFLGSELVNMAGSQLVTFAVGGIVGLAAVGSLRGAQLLLGPVYVMAVGVQMSLVPEAARMIDSPARLRRLSFGVTGLLTAGGAAYGLVVLLLPDAIGRGVLGASWDGAHAVLLPMAVMWVGPLLTLGPRIGLRALEEAARTLQVSSLQSVSTLIGGVVGALFGGTLGAAWGMAIGVILSIAAWWLQYRLALRRHVERGVALGRQQQPPPAARPDQPSRAVPPGGA